MDLIKVTTIRVAKLASVTSAIVAMFMLSACVSDTLGTTNTQPTQPTLAQIQAENPDIDPIQRQQAIAEIRQKQEVSGSDVLTNAYSDGNGPNEPLTQAQSAAKIEALQQDAVQNEITVGDAEIAAKQARIKELQLKAQTHYDSAVNSIEN